MLRKYYNCMVLVVIAMMPCSVFPSDIVIVNQDAKCLYVHNRLRLLHRGIGELQWDAQLANGAAAWARHLLDTGSFSHSSDRSYGENLGGGYGTYPSCVNVVWRWYSEYKYHDYRSNDWNKASGHFTQVIWKSSLKVGVGIAYSAKSRKWVVCARYTPAGNMLLNYLANVFPIRSGETIPSIAQIEKEADTGVTMHPNPLATSSPTSMATSHHTNHMTTKQNISSNGWVAYLPLNLLTSFFLPFLASALTSLWI